MQIRNIKYRTMETGTIKKIFAIGQVVLGIMLFTCISIVFFAHAFSSPIFISFCLLAIWYISYKLLERSIIEYRGCFSKKGQIKK